MNKIYCLITCVILLSFSCKKQGFLDPVSISDLNEHTVFADSAHTMDFLAEIYAGDDFSFNVVRFNDGNGHTGLAAACDEAEGSHSNADNTYLQFASGSVNPNTVKDDAYVKPYTYIRAVNQFLKHINTANFSVAQRQRAKGEALFLRAWYYFIMLKHYGGVPIVGDTVYAASDVISSKRSSFATTVNYITSQCDAAQALLQPAYDQLNYGRITTGACLALKSRVLLYAASPLFNDPAPTVHFSDQRLDTLIRYPNYNIQRWATAAQAAQAVMSTEIYSLVDAAAKDPVPGRGFYHVFINKLNSELIFFRAAGGSSLEQDFVPPSVGGTTQEQGTYPYQELVDDFDMVNGKPITDPASGYDAAHPYDNRDPRFNYTISHNLTARADYSSGTFALRSILTYVNSGQDAVGIGTPTGYYVNKMLNDSTDIRDFYTGSDRAYPLIRYAEILLNFAEATNEYAGPTTVVYDQLKALRKRAGIQAGSDGNYGLTPGMTQDQMRAAIQHERRIELAFEEHRFWDVRRWKIAPVTDNKLMNGENIVKVGDSYFYQKIAIRQHTFNPKNYLWPFPQHEVSKNQSKPGLQLVQNPGY